MLTSQPAWMPANPAGGDIVRAAGKQAATVGRKLAQGCPN